MKLFCSFFVFVFLFSHSGVSNNELPLIPIPVNCELYHEEFVIDDSTVLIFDSSDPELLSIANYFNHYLSDISKYSLKYNSEGDKHIVFEIIDDNNLGDEGYRLNVSSNKIEISANTDNGIFWAVQTIFQILPAYRTNADLVVPGLKVEDYPRFGWRGMMLDESRHFFGEQTVKQFIDLLARYKFNVFHWHLVDDPGWRIEIKQYPNLTETGAWRVDRFETPWLDREPPKEDEKATYGGYYTQEQIKEIVNYASKRNITIVPEIELPGHSVAALASYPEYSCTREPQMVITGGNYPEGIQSSYCPGYEGTFEFLENVLLEVLDLFPSEYIHIGGDEVDKSYWKECERCQQRIEEEQLADVDELQSYMIRRIEQFLASHGRRLIGWDEILEGGLAPGATVMSWRGEAGGIEAAQMGHDVIMTPGRPCYFDHYQSGPEGEPLAIGGMNTLKDVYDYEPVPSELNEQEALHVLGSQANVWTEFIPTVSHLEYMVLPRLLALSEVVWSSSDSREWEGFNERMRGAHFRYFDKRGLNYHEGNTNVIITPVVEDGTLTVNLETEIPGAEIYFTTDGSEPSQSSNKYSKPLIIEDSVILKAIVVEDGRILSISPSKQSFDVHKATGRDVKYEHPVSRYYQADGPNSLTDGVRGTLNVTEFWHGFNAVDMVAEIDLGSVKEINRLALGALQKRVDWIFPPRRVIFELSKDGESFQQVAVAEMPIKEEDESEQTIDYKAFIDSYQARYIRVVAENFGVCPPNHPGSGEPTWLFVDEIIVD
ncbi:glycoside hydrolase family 20 protein [Marinilabiliaceae bacterium ANBcel2]|nr:glycoside hydrolase family 20 protein [Marinilabiliaceae bacterium ANBcel2]